MLPQCPQELLDEKRVPSRALHDPGHEHGGYRSLECVPHEFSDPRLVERLQPNRLGSWHQLRERPLRLGPRGQKQDDRPLVTESRELERELEARRIRPVHILDREDQVALGGHGREPGRERLVQAAAKGLGLERRHAVVGRGDTQKSGQVGHCLWGRHIADERRISVFRVRVRRDAGDRAKKVRVRPICEPGTVREAAGL